jgi:hypothetical protein
MTADFNRTLKEIGDPASALLQEVSPCMDQSKFSLRYETLDFPASELVVVVVVVVDPVIVIKKNRTKAQYLILL